jgi:hypothetical protein
MVSMVFMDGRVEYWLAVASIKSNQLALHIMFSLAC